MENVGKRRETLGILGESMGILGNPEREGVRYRLECGSDALDAGSELQSNSIYITRSPWSTRVYHRKRVK